MKRILVHRTHARQSERSRETTSTNLHSSQTARTITMTFTQADFKIIQALTSWSTPSRKLSINCHTNATGSRTQTMYAADTVMSDVKKEKEVGFWNQEVRQLIIKSGTNFLQSKIYLLQLKKQRQKGTFLVIACISLWTFAFIYIK